MPGPWSCARLFRVTVAVVALFGCSKRELTVEGVQREVHLDANGRVVDGTVVSTPARTENAPPAQGAPTTTVPSRTVPSADHGRNRVVDDGPPAGSDGVDSLPVGAFPERLELDAAGLGPLRLGATEAQLTQALGLVVTRVEFPPPPPCFGPANRVLAVGPIYFGMHRGALEAVWVTDAELQTDQRRIPLALANTVLGGDNPVLGGDNPVLDGNNPRPVPGTLTVNVGLDPNAVPQGLRVAEFGGGWVALQPATRRSGVSVVAEGPTDGAEPDRLSGFGIAARPCLRSDFSSGVTGPGAASSIGTTP